MIPKSIILLFFFILTATAPVYAQNPVPVIDALDIEIWPDYDRASVLVLLTGTLPGDTPLPATVNLPLPEAVQINAVARIDGKDGNMIADIFWSIDSPNTLTFSTPDLRFRVEYYFPYTIDSNRRSFDFTWSAATRVDNLQIRVQRPISASSLNTEPAPANVVKSWDGFDYHTFPARAVPAGQSFALHVDYQMAGPRLSVTSMPSPKTGAQPSASPAASNTGSGINWALAAIVAGGLTIFGALIWQFASRRRSADIRKPIDARVEKRAGTRFCRNCGEPVDKDDRFCRGCGSEL
jgi:hypothetical protein